MRKLLVIFLLSLGMWSSAFADNRPDIGRYVKVYSGGEGVVVWVMRIGPPASREALVQIGGIDHQWDQRIQKMTLEPTAINGTKYVVISDGQRREVLTVDQGRAELAVPGMPEKPMLTYDKSRSEQEKPESFLTAFQEQK